MCYQTLGNITLIFKTPICWFTHSKGSMPTVEYLEQTSRPAVYAPGFISATNSFNHSVAHSDERCQPCRKLRGGAVRSSLSTAAGKDLQRLRGAVPAAGLGIATLLTALPKGKYHLPKHGSSAPKVWAELGFLSARGLLSLDKVMGTSSCQAFMQS